jgi:hypothetical protein
MTASTYARTRLPPIVSVATTRNAAVFGATFGNASRFAETIVTFWPRGAPSRMMSAKQVAVFEDVPRLQEAVASFSVR